MKPNNTTMNLTCDTLLREANLARSNGLHGLADYFTTQALHFRPLPLKAKGTPNPPSVGKKTHK